MGSFLNYVAKNKNITMKEKPFNIVDALVLTAIVYFPFPYDSFFSGDKYIHVNKLIKDYLARTDKVKNTFSPKLDRRLAQLIVDSKRYSSLFMAGYICRHDNDAEKQFTALSFYNNKSVFVAFMGTDTSLVGWKEDLNLSFKKCIPSQESAVNYLKIIAEKFPDKEIYVGGHSKGGNLAMYAGTFVTLEVQKRIKLVFNFDGPGFLEEITKTKEYHRIRKRIMTVVPSYSFVGIIFEKSDNFLIIKSRGLLLTNHLFYNWCVNDDDFEYVKKLSKMSIRAHYTVRYLMRKLNDYERETFVRETYKLLRSSGAYTVFDLFKNIPTLVKEMFNGIKAMDEKDKKTVSKAMRTIVYGALRHSKEISEFEKINSYWLEDDK